MADADEFAPGDRVRVRGDCPHTLPHYARVLIGQVVGPSDDGSLQVEFGEGRVFPVEPRWLELAPDPTDDA